MNRKMLLFISIMISAYSFDDLAIAEESMEDFRQFGVSLRGGFFSGISAKGIDGYYNTNEKLQVGLLYNRGSASYGSAGGTLIIDFETGETTDVDSGSTAKAEASQVGAFARYSLFDSFNVTGGLVQRSINVSYRHIPPPYEKNTSEVSGTVSDKSLALLFQIGNRWVFRNGFSIGADWIGYTLPIARIQRNGNANDLDALQFKQKKELKEAVTGSAILQALMLDIGYQF